MPAPIVLRKLRPYFGRISVIESPVDEEQRESGLIVPLDTEDVTRGVIINIDKEVDAESDEYISARLKEGTVIYFQGGVKVGDMIFVQSANIIAYEED